MTPPTLLQALLEGDGSQAGRRKGPGLVGHVPHPMDVKGRLPCPILSSQPLKETQQTPDALHHCQGYNRPLRCLPKEKPHLEVASVTHKSHREK